MAWRPSSLLNHPHFTRAQWDRCSGSTIDRILLDCRADEACAARAPIYQGVYAMTPREPFAMLLDFLTVEFKTYLVTLVSRGGILYVYEGDTLRGRPRLLYMRDWVFYRFHWLAPLPESD